ncbi:MAG: hypothetical protein U0836_10480 [Pirellulales bacterium]
MVTTVSPAVGEAATVSVAPGPLQLRVRGTRHDGRLVELHARKCAVGGGRRATLRLAGPALEPIEVLIVRGAEATVAKAWSSAARLNGRRFDTAPLAPGDLLAVGPVELEVVACPPPAGLPESPAALPRFTEIIPQAIVPESIAARPRSGTDRQRSRRLLATLRTARQELEAAMSAAATAGVETDRLQRLLQAGQSELEQLRAEAHCARERSHAEQTQEEESLAVARAELAAQRIELNHARQEVERQTAELLHRETTAAGALAGRKTEIAAREESLGLAQAELDRLQMEADEHRRQMEADRRLLAERQAELEERSEALDRHDEQARLRSQELDRRVEEIDRAAAENREFEERRQQAGDEQAAFEAQRLAWETQRSEQQARLTEEQQRLSDEAERLEHARRTLELERADLERERADQAEAARSAARQEPANDQPTAARDDHESGAENQEDDVFARLRALSLLKDRDAETEAEQDAPRTSADHDEADEDEREESPPAWPSVVDDAAEEEEAPQAPSAVDSSHADEDHEESIQDYMNRLLQRVRGEAPVQHKPAAKTPTHSPTTYRPAPVQPVQAPVAAEPRPVPATPRKSAAPERSSDLLAMRELANLSAQTALDAYAHRRWASAAVGKVIVSVFALVACLTLMAALPGWSTLKIISGGAALVIAVFWGLQAGILAQQVRAARQRRQPRPAGTPASGESTKVPHPTSDDDAPFVPTVRDEADSADA